MVNFSKKSKKYIQALGVMIMLSIRNSFAYAALVVATGCFTSVSHARCVLPVPDGGDETPSPANVEGYIVSIEKSIVVIRQQSTNRNVSVRVPKNKPIYSAFGGDGDPSELKVGQKAWVWFVGCKQSGTKTPEAAYFQIFSKDPNDRP